MLRYSREQVEVAVFASLSPAETLRRLRMCPTGGGAEVLKKYLGLWDISTAHFDPAAAQRAGLHQTARPLLEVLVEGSSYHHQHLKRRLFAEVRADGWRATARQYGVSDNAIKKWARQYEAELGIEAAGALPPRSLRSRCENGRPPMRPTDKLDEARAREALGLLATGKTPVEVAERLGVSKWTIYTLSRGESHRWLERPDDRESA